MVPLETQSNEAGIVRRSKPKPSQALVEFMTTTQKLLGRQIVDPMARRFNHDFKAAVRKHRDNPEVMEELEKLRKLRDTLVSRRREGVSEWT